MRTVDPRAVCAGNAAAAGRLQPPQDAGHNSPQAIHLTLEAMKLGLADRDTYYADPLFADVPLSQLLSTEYHGGAAH